MKRPPHTSLSRKPLDADRTYHDVVTDEAFEGHRKTQSELAVAFSMTASALVEAGTSDSGYRLPCVERLHVAATMDGFVQAQHILNGPPLSKQERDDLKRNWIIPFNHAVGALVDNDSSATHGEVLTYLTRLYRKVNSNESPENYEQVSELFNNVLVGMAQENVVEQLGCYLGYAVEETNVDDELKGVDRYFGIDNKWEPVDVKTSRRGAADARAKDYRGHLILCSHVHPASLEGAFRLTDAQLARHAGRFQQELNEDWQRVQQIRNKTRR